MKLNFGVKKSLLTRWLAVIVLLAGAVAVTAQTSTGTAAESATPHWTSLLPPLVAIGLALILREVIGSLLLGLYVGSLLLTPSEPGAALTRLATDYMLGALSDPGHAMIVLFSLMLGAMVGVLSRSGAMAGIVEMLGRVTTTRRGGMLVSWLMGLIIFFDDYANTLLVGNTLRPYSDRLRLSRAKLAYIVDSTAAPVASIAVISTWVGFQIGLIRDASEGLEGVGDAYLLFLRSIPYSAYSIMAIILVASISWWVRDIGPMRRAEVNAADGNDSTREEAAEEDAPIVHLTPGRAMIVGLVPIGFVILATFVGLYITGMRAVGHSAPLFELLGSADSASVLLGSSFLGMLVASLLAGFVGRIPVAEISEGLIDGIRAMVPAMVILLLAWSLGEVTTRLGTASFVIEAVSGNLPPGLLPATLFIVASVTAFSTGTSWGAMAILIPIAIPLAHQLPLEAGSSVAVTQGVLLGSVGAVLAGAVFGDHCSPISDTTILSSMASGCRHIDHVNTQIPYALLAGGAAIVFGYLPSGFGVPPWIGILLGGALLFLLPRWWPTLRDSGGNGTP